MLTDQQRKDVLQYREIKHTLAKWNELGSRIPDDLMFREEAFISSLVQGLTGAFHSVLDVMDPRSRTHLMDAFQQYHHGAAARPPKAPKVAKVSHENEPTAPPLAKGIKKPAIPGATAKPVPSAAPITPSMTHQAFHRRVGKILHNALTAAKAKLGNSGLKKRLNFHAHNDWGGSKAPAVVPHGLGPLHPPGNGLSKKGKIAPKVELPKELVRPSNNAPAPETPAAKPPTAPVAKQPAAKIPAKTSIAKQPTAPAAKRMAPKPPAAAKPTGGKLPPIKPIVPSAPVTNPKLAPADARQPPALNLNKIKTVAREVHEGTPPSHKTGFAWYKWGGPKKVMKFGSQNVTMGNGHTFGLKLHRGKVILMKHGMARPAALSPSVKKTIVDSSERHNPNKIVKPVLPKPAAPKAPIKGKKPATKTALKKPATPVRKRTGGRTRTSRAR